MSERMGLAEIFTAGTSVVIAFLSNPESLAQVTLADFENRRLVAIRAAEVVVENDRGRGFEAVAAEQALGIAVFGAIFLRQCGREA